VKPTANTRVHYLPANTTCQAIVRGKLVTTKKQKLLIKLNWYLCHIRARLQRCHLFDGTVYSATRYWQDQHLVFYLEETSFSHLLARWKKVRQTEVTGFRYLTCPALFLTTDQTTKETYFVLGKTSGTYVGNTINFIGGTLDQKHTETTDPLTANLWSECAEEVGITPAHVATWRFAFLAETEGWFSLIAVVHLHLTPTQLQKHFQRFQRIDREKEITELIFVPATKQDVHHFVCSGQAITRPVSEVLQAAVRQQHTFPNAA
jgi:hypothetical protein